MCCKRGEKLFLSFFLKKKDLLFICVCVLVLQKVKKVSGPLQLELQELGEWTAYLSAGNWMLVLCKSRKY